jgi:hypothetical protein
MTPAPTRSPDADVTPDARPPVGWDRPVRWWREIAVIVGFYLLYSGVRNRFGSASVSAADAYANAARLIDVERALRVFNEATVQSWFLGADRLLWVINVYYGTLHFLVPIGVLVYLGLRHPASYRLWRTAILATTGIALIGFALFPLMPPRLLCDCPYGAGPVAVADGQPAFVDTLATYGGLWSFDSETVQAVSNQYAAMPSLHVAWALWCALALLPHLRRSWARALALAYPLFTTFAVVVTGNHFWLDAVGGAVVLALGIGVASLWRRLNAGRGDSAGTVGATCGPGRSPSPASKPVAGAGAPHGTERRPLQEA